MSIGEAVDLVELGSEPVKVTPLEPAGFHVEEVSVEHSRFRNISRLSKSEKTWQRV